MQPPTTTAVLLLLLLTAAAAFPDRFLKRPSPSAHSHSHSPQQYIELTHPLPSSLLPPACTHRIVTHSFANTIDSPPFSAPYSPPPPSLCPTPPWSFVALELYVSSRGEQYDRIAAVWLGGVELLRTSTAEPNEDGIFWRVRKDVTRYSSLLSRSNIEVTVMLENIINDEFTGIYHVNVTLVFYSLEGGNRPRASMNQLSDPGLSSKSGLGLEEFGGNSGAASEDSVNLATLGAATWNYNSPPADLIFPVSDDGDRGSWYKIERASDLHSKRIRIPANTVRAVLELCVSFHGNDEFWYSNPPDSYIRENNLTTGRGNGAYREVLVMIDGNLVGSEVPFPVVFTGGINPLFWEPIVAIGAFTLPSYDIEDVTRYSSLLSRSNIEVTVMLENIINDEFTGIYHVNVTLVFYSLEGGNRPRASMNQLSDPGLSSKSGLGLEEFGGNSGAASEDSVNLATLGAATWNYNSPPADLIFPVSDDGDRGSWYRIERASDLHSKRIRIPANTVRAVLELCVSFHGNDEFWYSNPPDSYIRENNLTTGRGNGAYREVLVMIDGNLVGSEVPFPVVFTGGINPLFWEPIVAIGAFILPSYDIELTPFLGMLLDCKAHEFAIGVASGISYWLVNANLHLWLDHGSKRVRAKSVAYTPPAHNVERVSQFKELDGSFRVKAKRKAQFAGWVKSSAGNLTTIVSTLYRVKNSISFTGNGTYKLVKQKMKANREVRIKNEAGYPLARAVVKRRYPLRVITSTLPGCKKDTYVLVTNVSHALVERYADGDLSSSVRNVQDSRGWMEVKDHNVLSGTADTKQSYSFRDELFCYSRKAEAADGKLIRDNSTFTCASSL